MAICSALLLEVLVGVAEVDLRRAARLPSGAG